MEQTAKKHKKHHYFSLSTGSRRNRKTYGDVMMLIIIGLMALFSFIPLLMSVCMSLKPINELFYYPPRIFPERPTFDNFRMLFNLMKTTWVPFERYAFNTVFITLATTAGHVMLASMAAYPLAKMKIPFVRLFNNLILISLMFVSAINDIANYLTITWFGWLDTYLAVIVPSIGASLGLFIMKNYMSTIPDTLLEAARIDGCSESGIYWRIVMPLAKPVWLTVVILMFQQIWSQNNSQYVYSEQLKTLPYALTQITSGGMVRMGAAQAVGVLMLLVPALVFMFSQTRIIDTMATSGMKE
ncbi:MAG: carbohydrate ABC transporter permease [Clostridiales bacterium]|nr:carbohydrate ABC transporter permease [Clostridiales bacterium]